MLAPTKNCLTTDQLQRFLQGDLSSDEFESASDHLDQCRDCQSSIERIGGNSKASPPPTPSWLEPVQADPQHAEVACQFAVHRLITSPRSSITYAPTAKPVDPREHVELGPYRILSDLGRGGMGTVCLAEHQRLKRRCAIKLLPPMRVTQPGWLERFEREMAAVASLEHPGIVRAHDAGCHDGWHYLVMEYLEGLDVGRVVDRLGTLPVGDACEIVRQAAIAIAHVHRAGLVHRDIKPSNLMLTRSGTIKLLDLGLVLAGDDPLAGDDRLTTVGHLMGTLPAMSPEQLIDSRRVDASSDIYSLGATLYRLIAGQWPFDSSCGIAQRILRMTSEAAPSLQKIRPATDARLVALIDRMLDRDPKQRPTAEEVAAQITDWTSEADLPALLTRAEQTGEAAPMTGVPSRPSFARVEASQGLSGVASQNVVPPTSPPRSLGAAHYAMGLLAIAALLAVVTIKIQTDKGQVHIETDGSDVQVAISPETASTNQPFPTSIEKPITVEPLYQGKGLQHWFDTLEREQEIESVGKAMKAIELLSRDTDRRREAAQKTLLLARKYGSIQYDDVNRNAGGFGGGDSDPSRRYMGHLRITFPGYFAQPAIDVIEDELVSGNAKSKIAAIVLLDEYLDGVYDSTEYPERRITAKTTIKELANSSSGISQAQRLVSQLGIALEDYRNSSDPLAAAKRQCTWDLAKKLDEAADGRLRGEAAWMSDYVIAETNRSIAEFQASVQQPAADAQESTDGSSNRNTNTSIHLASGAFQRPPSWLPPAPIFAEAIKLHRNGKLSMPIDFAIAVLFHHQFAWYSVDKMSETFDLLSTMSPEAEQSLVTTIEKAIDGFIAMSKANPNEPKFIDHSGQSQARQNFSTRGGIWASALPFYAHHVPDTEQAAERLERLVDWLSDGGPQYDKTLVVEAQTILASRANESR